jgi:branched-chain amino acid transport system substrate-binding protein
MISRRGLLAAGGAAVAAAGVGGGLARPAVAQGAPLRLGVMLPFSGTFAALGENILAAVEMYIAEKGGRIGGRTAQIIRLDDESNPANAVTNVNRLVGRDRAEALIGTVHSGVVMALVQAARERQMPLIIPNAGNASATGELCSTSVFRSSFSNWQPAYAAGLQLARSGVKRAAWMSWDYAAGNEAGAGFRDGLRAGGAELGALAAAAVPRDELPAAAGADPRPEREAVGVVLRGRRGRAVRAGIRGGRVQGAIPADGLGLPNRGDVAGQGAAAEGIRTRCITATGWTTRRTTRSGRRSARAPTATRTSTRCRGMMRRRSSMRG